MADSILEEWRRIADIITSACKKVCGDTPVSIDDCEKPNYWLVKMGKEPISILRIFDPQTKPMVAVYTVIPLSLQYVECEITYEGTDLAAGITQVVEVMTFDQTIKDACTRVGLCPSNIWRPNKPLIMTFCMRALTFGRWTLIVERRKGGKWDGVLHSDYQEHTPPERQVVLWSSHVVPLADLLCGARSSLIENMTCDAGYAYAKIVKNFGKVGITDPAVVQERMTAVARAILEEERLETQRKTHGGEG